MLDEDSKIDSLYKELGEIRETLSVIEKNLPLNLPVQDNDNSRHTNPKTYKRILPALAVILIITAAVMTIYEYTKQMILPGISIWESHLITIIFSSIVATGAAFFAIRRIEFLRQKSENEIVRRKQYEAELKKAKDNLELKVKERTTDLYRVNENLKKENQMRKEAEEEIRRYAEELLESRDLLESRADELAELNHKLEYSESELLELNNSKDKFFAILAHDLRGPFTALMGMTSFLESEAVILSNDEVARISGSISASARKVYSLLENLLQWSLLQTKTLEFSVTEFDMQEVANNIVDLYSGNAAQKDIELVNQIGAPFEVTADKNMINTVLRNLVANALKFTRQYGKVNISAEKKGGELIVSVADNGVGLEPSELENLFEFKNTTMKLGTGKEKGTGLGLVLCREFVEKNNGRIWGENNQEDGSRFSFTVPLAK